MITWMKKTKKNVILYSEKTPYSGIFWAVPVVTVCFPAGIRGVFIAQSNIEDGVFWEDS